MEENGEGEGEDEVGEAGGVLDPQEDPDCFRAKPIILEELYEFEQKWSLIVLQKDRAPKNKQQLAQ